MPVAGRKLPVTMNGTPAPERPQSPGEETANSISHGVGLLAALVATPVLLHAARRGNRLDLAGAAVFSATLVLLCLASTLYHALPKSGAKRTFRALDHSAVVPAHRRHVHAVRVQRAEPWTSISWRAVV